MFKLLNQTSLSLLLIAIGTLFPLLSYQFQGQGFALNLYQIDIRLFLFTWSLIALVAFTFYGNYQKKFALLRWVLTAWFLFIALAFYLKAADKFNFHFAEHISGQLIQYQWSWGLILFGVLMLLLAKTSKH